MRVVLGNYDHPYEEARAAHERIASQDFATQQLILRAAHGEEVPQDQIIRSQHQLTQAGLISVRNHDGNPNHLEIELDRLLKDVATSQSRKIEAVPAKAELEPLPPSYYQARAEYKGVKEVRREVGDHGYLEALRDRGDLVLPIRDHEVLLRHNVAFNMDNPDYIQLFDNTMYVLKYYLKSHPGISAHYKFNNSVVFNKIILEDGDPQLTIIRKNNRNEITQVVKI
jgi:hypothetical protein